MVFRLDFCQITFHLIKKAFATQQFALLAASIIFYDLLAWVCAEIKITSLGFLIFEIFFRCSFFSFSFLFAAVIGLLLGLLAVKKSFQESIIETGKFDHGVAMCSGRKFCSDFFTQLFVHISKRPITLTWASLERSYPSAEADHR